MQIYIPFVKMKFNLTAVFSLISLTWCKDLIFPPDFKFGVATSAYQIEGAINVADRTDCIWDEFIRTNPHLVSDLSNASASCESYYHFKRDIEMAVELGVQTYRISISWSRLLPNGFANKISEDGKRYYSDLIDEIVGKGIEPLVTLYHFDLPQKLQEFGGWTNPLMSDWFSDYARVAFSLYGDRVKTWITINEPLLACDTGYAYLGPPGIDDSYGKDLCLKYMLIGHAKAWRVYDEEFRMTQHGKISFSSLFFWIEPKTEDDIEVVELVKEYWESRFSHPIYSKEGGWPPKLERVLSEKMKEGKSARILPSFSKEEIDLVKGTFDFYALNHYTTNIARKAVPGDKVGVWPFGGLPGLDVVFENNDNWKYANASMSFAIYPEGLRKQISWLRSRYGDIEFIITENGFPSREKNHNDYARIDYLKSYLHQWAHTVPMLNPEMLAPYVRCHEKCADNGGKRT